MKYTDEQILAYLANELDEDSSAAFFVVKDSALLDRIFRHGAKTRFRTAKPGTIAGRFIEPRTAGGDALFIP